MPGFGWTAASLIPANPASAYGVGGVGLQNVSQVGTPAAQTFTPQTVPQLNVQPQMNSILSRILGPNFALATNPSPILGSQALAPPNYLAQGLQGTQPIAAPNGFTQFGNSFWRMPPVNPQGTTSLPNAYNEINPLAPAATSSGSPSAWVSTPGNLFNI